MKELFKYYFKKILNFKEKHNWCLGYFKSDKKFNLTNKNLIDKFNNALVFRPPNDQFWADPFLIRHKQKLFIFFEKFYKKKNKGVICVCELKNNELINFKDIIVEPYHLSYPMLFISNNKFFLVPESYQNKKIQFYESVKFPFKWKKINTLFNDEITADPTIFKYNRTFWIFINKTKDNLNDLNKKLYLYKLSENFKKIIPHKKNPVVSSLNGGRNAGNLFRLGKKIIRPGQINTKKNYGYGINFYEIKKINLREYREKKVATIKSKNLNNCLGIHHFCKVDDNYIFDLNLLK